MPHVHFAWVRASVYRFCDQLLGLYYYIICLLQGRLNGERCLIVAWGSGFQRYKNGV